MKEKSLFSTEPKTDEEILRASVIAEYDAINLYEQLANKTSNNNIKKVLLDIANEEKVHVGEFERLLGISDEDHDNKVLEGGYETVDIITNKSLELPVLKSNGGDMGGLSTAQGSGGGVTTVGMGSYPRRRKKKK